MANTIGIRIAVNSSETDVDVEADNADWTAKVGQVKIDGGGGSFWRDSQPFRCQFTANIPWEDAPKVRTITVAATVTSSASMPDGTVTSGTNHYRILFHGDVQSCKGEGAPDSGIVIFYAVSEMSALLGRKARTAASNNSFIRELLADIETAHSLTVAGNVCFPTMAEFYSCDRPVQKGQSNGTWIRKMLAGSGINMSEEWGGTITAPELRWRADWMDTTTYPSITTTRLWNVEFHYPWLAKYEDVGVEWKDFVARINIEGENSAAAEHYGWARLSLSAQRQACGNRDVTLSSWIDTATQCQNAARRLLGHQGEPSWMKMKRVTLPIETIHAAIDADTVGVTYPEEETWRLAACMLGDTVDIRSPFDNGSTRTDWPAHAPAGGAVYDTLNTIWKPALTDDLEFVPFDTWSIRTIVREWRPNGGWLLTYGMDPTYGIPAADIADYGNGTY